MKPWDSCLDEADRAVLARGRVGTRRRAGEAAHA